MALAKKTIRPILYARILFFHNHNFLAMKTMISFFALALCCLMFSPHLSAQEDDPGYAIVEYMKVKPGMNAKYLECEKAWKLIHQERKKAGLITGWDLEQVILPGGTHTEYDYLTITFLKNWDAIGRLDESWNDETWAMLTKSLTPAQKEVANNAGQYRDLVKREIWTASDMVFASEGQQAKYRVENFMKIPTGGWDDWMEMESRFVKPVHEKNIALGNRAGWAMAFMVFPRGEACEYDASTMDFYSKWEDMDNDEGAAWESVYPGMSQSHVGNRIESTRTLVRAEVRALVDSVR
jgi:hypothetical protein